MYYIIINPSAQSGGGMRVWQSLEPIFQKKGVAYQLMQSSHEGHIAKLVQSVVPEDDTQPPVNLILLGGDGTLNEALQGIRDFSKVNIGYIPTGSSNDLARDLHLSKNPREILSTILDGKVHRKVDLGVLTFLNKTAAVPGQDIETAPDKRYFVVSSGIGFDAAVCEKSLSSNIKTTLNKLKLGKLTYLGIALQQLIMARSASCELRLDERQPIHIKQFLFTAFMIHKYEGGGFQFCPQADDRDGLLDICMVGNMPKLLILFALPTAYFGKHYLFPQITHYQAQKVTIKTSVPLWVHTDGEVFFSSDHLCLSCEKQKINFLM